MRKNVRSHISVVMIITVMVILLSNYSIKVAPNLKIEYCFADVICFVEHMGKLVLIPIIGIYMYSYTKDMYSVNYLIRHSRKKFITMQFLKHMVISMVMSVYQVILTVIMASGITQVGCNWEKSNSAPNMLRGVMIKEHYEIYVYLLVYLFTLFMTWMVAGSIIICCQTIFDNPFFGYLINIVMMAVELPTNSVLMRIVYSVADMKPEKIYLHGVTSDMFVRPIIVIAILLTVSYIVSNRKDYLKIK